MIQILREPEHVEILSRSGQEARDAKVRFEFVERKLHVYITADTEEPEFIRLRWDYVTDEPVRVMGDKWERAYADLSWHSLSAEKFMPWYFMVDNGKQVAGCGVMVQPNSFVCFQYDSKGVTCWMDVRCGSVGVQLKGRELLAATIVCEQYEDMSAFDATKAFCKVMSPNPILPKEPVYGSNNWYYAYGNSTAEGLQADAKVLADLTKENSNRPFMVIDDGWSMHSCSGPWVGNERHGDMGQIADKFKETGVRPGIWVRLLHDEEAEEMHPEWRVRRGDNPDELACLDPSHPEVRTYLKEVLNRISNWGYELLKHDYSTYDLFGAFGMDLNGMITYYGNWSFYDRTKTSAEIVLDFYRLIKEETRGMMILGCNTVSHLCAGLVELNRIGDDTSGKKWDRTRALGINTLAFRLPQHGSFYAVDADCVGILGENIPWSLNRQWLTLLAKSGTPLFVSAEPSALTEEMKQDLREAFYINSIQEDVAEPLDWQYNDTPDRWMINGEAVEFDWIQDSYPGLIYSRIPML